MSINNGPIKKQNINSGAQTATPQPTWMNVDESVKLLTDLVANKRYDLFFETIKPLNFKEISAISVALYRRKNVQTLAMLRSDKGGLWSYYLAELHKMDASVPLSPPANFPENKKDSWHYYAVMKATKAIYQQQTVEIDFLKLRHSRHAFWAHFHTVEVDTLDVNMDVLLDRHRALNAFNIELIKPFINPQSKWLDISGAGYFGHKGVTRIPEELFEDKTLESYWQKLEILDCYGNKIHQLPVFIGKLLSLQRLNCSQNKLKRLPEEIGNLVNLTTLEFQFNEIEELPKSIGNLAQLWMLACSNNYLSSLPDSIDKLVSIRLIDIKANNLTQLPNILFELKKLCQLDCRYNRIQQLPTLLQAKFGEEWSTMTLMNQCEVLTQQTVFLPLFELNGTQALELPFEICQLEVDSEPEEQQESDKTKDVKLKLL